MCSFICTTKPITDTRVNLLASKRGPDFTNSVKIDKFNIIHNLLDISKKRIIQPIVKQDSILLFNGEIYEPKTTEDTLSILPIYEEYGERFVERINGEYAIGIIDLAKNIVLLYSDIFATKPLFYSVDETDIGFSSYKSDLELLEFNNIKRVDSSTIIKINLSDHSVTVYKHSSFNLNEYKTEFDDCIAALEDAFRYRIKQETAVGISSGHDSGSILQWSANNNIGNSFYYVYTKKEDKEIMEYRKALCDIKKLKFKTINYFDNKELFNRFEKSLLITQMEDYDRFKEEPSIFLLSKMMRYIKRDNIDIFISGQGSDEILTNYFTRKNFFRDLKKQFPWRNFYGGTNRQYIDQLEYIGGSYGIEVRYPFLDKVFIQEFLSLTKDAKNSVYKSVLNEYLSKNNMPFKIEKVGLSLLKP